MAAPAPGRARPLGVAWLATHGPAGRLPQEQREELKTELLRDLAARPGVRLEGNVLEEVDRFLDSGRVSDSNLSRLERRVMQRSSGAMTARAAPGAASSAASVVSEFSAASSRLEGPRSARLPFGAGGGSWPASPAMPSVPERQPLPLPEGPINKWSDVAKYAKALEEQEKFQKKETQRSSQQHMAHDLQAQIEIKKQQQKAKEVEERRLFENQEAELQRWRASQSAQQDEVRRRALEENKDREVQNEENRRRREQERQAKMLEDTQLVERAGRELDFERQTLSERKANSRARQLQLWQESSQGRADAGELRRARLEEERKKVQEYGHMLDEQEHRNRQIIPPIRGVNAVILAPPGGRRGGESYTEQNVMKQLREVNDHAEQAEQEKLKALKEQRQQTQDYLFQQIAERNKNRERALEQKRAQKVQAQAATADYLDAERRRIEEARTKNVQHRLELERQMAAKLSAVKPRSCEDQMSPAEKAINQHLIKEAEELRLQQQQLLALDN